MSVLPWKYHIKQMQYSKKLIPIDFHLLRIGPSCLIPLPFLESVVYKILH
jgi:hypothetical protein